MNEHTLIKTMPLPQGRDWEWFADANIVVLAPHLCEEGRERALTEVQAHWRRSCIRVLPVPGEPCRGEPNVTQPLAILSPRTG